MDPLTGLIGGAVGGLFNFLGTSQNNSNQMAMLQQSEAYQTQMSNTAYQRASKDMQAAGLNPMMMFGSGGAASTPNAPNFGTPQSPLKGIGDSISKALDMAVTAKSVDKMSEEIAKLKTSEGVDVASQRVLGVEAGLKGEQAGQVRASTQATLAGIPKIESESDVAKLLSAIANDPIGKRVLQGGMLGKSAADMIKPGTEVLESLGLKRFLEGYAGSSAKRSGLTPSQRQEVKDTFDDRFNAAKGN